MTTKYPYYTILGIRTQVRDTDIDNLLIGLTLASVVQMDCLFRDISDLSYLGEIIREDSVENIARKAYETKFIREGIAFQVDAIAIRKN